MLVLSAIAPIMSDDLWYSLGMDRKGLNDLDDVIRSCVGLYNKYGARLGTMGFFLMSFFGRWLFVLLNPLAFLLLGLLSFMLALGRSPAPDSMQDVGLLGMIYLVIGGAAPAITEVSFWANGAMQYLWGCAVVFAFLVPFRYLLEERRIISGGLEATLLMFGAGLIVGQATETIVPAAIGLIGFFGLIVHRKGENLPAWFWAGLAGLCIGFVIFAVAPGNFQRAASASSTTSWSMGILDRLVTIPPLLFNKFAAYAGRFLVRIVGGIALLAVFALLVDSLAARRNQVAVLDGEKLTLALLYTLASAGTIFSLFASPVRMSTRVYFGAGMMMILALALFTHVVFFERYPKLGRYVVAVTCFLCFMEMCAIAKELADIHHQDRVRLEVVRRAREAGQTVIEVPLIKRPRQRHVWLADITKDPGHARNRSFAFYYGFDKVIGADPDDFFTRYRSSSGDFSSSN